MDDGTPGGERVEAEKVVSRQNEEFEGVKREKSKVSKGAKMLVRSLIERKDLTQRRQGAKVRARDSLECEALCGFAPWRENRS